MITLEILSSDRVGLLDPLAVGEHAVNVRSHKNILGGDMELEFDVRRKIGEDVKIKPGCIVRLNDGIWRCHEAIVRQMPRIWKSEAWGEFLHVTAYGPWSFLNNRWHTLSYTTGTYTAKNIISDTMTALAIPYISTSTAYLEDPGRNLVPYSVTRRYFADIVKDVIAPGDSSTPPKPVDFYIYAAQPNMVSDDKPICYLHVRNTSTIDLVVTKDMVEGELRWYRDMDTLANYVMATYSGGTTAAAQDADSQAKYWRVDVLLDLSSLSQAAAEAARDRYLAAYKEPPIRVEQFTLKQRPTTELGTPVPFGGVRPGMVVKMADINPPGGYISTLYDTVWDVDNDKLTMTLGQMPFDVAALVAGLM